MTKEYVAAVVCMKKNMKIDWVAKEKELDALLSQYKGRSGTSYDCVIPVVGTGDDFFIVDLVKNKYGLNPCLSLTIRIQYEGWRS